MKFRYILLVLLMLMPVFVQAMSDKDIMEQVEYAIANEDWEVAEENYRIAVSENTEEADGNSEDGSSEDSSYGSEGEYSDSGYEDGYSEESGEYSDGSEETGAYDESGEDAYYGDGY